MNKFKIGDKVWVTPLARYDTIAGITDDGRYRLTKVWGDWSSSSLVSEAAHKIQQVKKTLDTQAREQYDRNGRAVLALTEPERYLFDSDAAYQEAYVIWAGKWWQYGDMPYMVRYYRNKYLMSNRFVLEWS
jgi:hypothetical protein